MALASGQIVSVSEAGEEQVAMAVLAERRFRPVERCLRMALVAGLLTTALISTVAPVSAAVVRNAAWPAQWKNPVSGSGGGTVGVTTNFGAFSAGCSNADRSQGYTYYLDSGYAAHLALDLPRASASDGLKFVQLRTCTPPTGSAGRAPDR